MPKNKIGVIEKIGVDADGLETFRVRVEAGTRERRSTKRVTIHGTMRNAQAAASMLYVELNSSLSERDIPEITSTQTESFIKTFHRLPPSFMLTA